MRLNKADAKKKKGTNINLNLLIALHQYFIGPSCILNVITESELLWILNKSAYSEVLFPLSTLQFAEYRKDERFWYE